MSDILLIGIVTAGATIISALIKVYIDFHLKRYRKMKKELDLHKRLESGYVELYRVENPKYYQKTHLAVLRELRKRLRGMGYQTPGYKDDD